MADTPEQSLLTSIIGGFCPVCTVPKDSMGMQIEKWPTRVPKNKKNRKENSDEKKEGEGELFAEPPK
jgi:hypothetical protein